jgi:hypothetical protein
MILVKMLIFVVLDVRINMYWRTIESPSWGLTGLMTLKEAEIHASNIHDRYEGVRVIFDDDGKNINDIRIGGVKNV